MDWIGVQMCGEQGLVGQKWNVDKFVNKKLTRFLTMYNYVSFLVFSFVCHMLEYWQNFVCSVTVVREISFLQV
jgi:hypothetical protein